MGRAGAYRRSVDSDAEITPGDPRTAVLLALRLGVCPTCGRELTATDRYGSGTLADGIFCSMRCLGGYPTDRSSGPGPGTGR